MDLLAPLALPYSCYYSNNNQPNGRYTMKNTTQTVAQAIRTVAQTVDVALEPFVSKQAQLWGAHSAAERDLEWAVKRNSPINAKSAQERMDKIDCALVAVREEMAPLVAVYASSRWARFYFVPGGHVHRSRCSTLRHSTTTYWLPEYAGASDEEIIAAAGDVACTVCFPDAPVNPQNSTVRYAVEERKTREAREVEAQERATKRTAAAAAAIMDGRGRVAFKTLRGLTNDLSRLVGYWVCNAAEQHHEQNFVEGRLATVPFSGSLDHRAKNAARDRAEVEAMVKLAADNGHDVSEYVAKAIVRHSKALDRTYFTADADLAL